MKHIHELDEAVDCVVRSGQATPGVLKRKLGIDSAEARLLLKKMEWLGIVGWIGRRRGPLVTPKEWAEVLAAPARTKSA